MAATQTDMLNSMMETADKGFDSFCEDISTMFSVEAKSTYLESVRLNTAGLKEYFKKAVAVNAVETHGTLDGCLYLLFDFKGLFILSGVIMMLPEKAVLKNANQGTQKKARENQDSVSEVAMLLAGTLERVFREEFDKDQRLEKTKTFIGKPWTKSGEHLDIKDDEEFTLVSYEMSIAPYPAFICSLILPDNLIKKVPDPNNPAQDDENQTESFRDQETASEEITEDKMAQADMNEQTEVEQLQLTKQENLTDQQTKSDSEKQTKDDIVTDKEPIKEQVSAGENDNIIEDNVVEEAMKEEQNKEDSDEKNTPADTQNAESSDASAEEPAKRKVQDDIAKNQQIKSEQKSITEADTDEAVTAESDKEGNDEQVTPAVEEEMMNQDTDKAKENSSREEPQGPISEAIEEILDTTVDSLNTAARKTAEAKTKPALLSITAAHIMQQRVTWARPDESVQQVLTKMQQSGCDYVLVGTVNKTPEGIVSRSDLSAAMSPYLKPLFAKWRRPIDDATLQIKIKWIMTKPVQTVNIDTSIDVLMDTMSQAGIRCLPVTDNKGNVQGIVTVFDIFKEVLK